MGEDLSSQSVSDAPDHLVATTISMKEIKLTWRDNSSGEDGFIIERKKGPTSTFGMLATVEANAESFIDNSSTLSLNTSYYYRVAYIRGGEFSPYSNTASATTLK